MDFYNNVAAIAAVLMFAKLVTHRTRKVSPGQVWKKVLTGFHTVGVIAAAVAIICSLIATADSTRHLQLWAEWSLAVSGLILVIDVLGADWFSAFQRREKAQDQALEKPSAQKAQ